MRYFKILFIFIFSLALVSCGDLKDKDSDEKPESDSETPEEDASFSLISTVDLTVTLKTAVRNLIITDGILAQQVVVKDKYGEKSFDISTEEGKCFNVRDKASLSITAVSSSRRRTLCEEGSCSRNYNVVQGCCAKEIISLEAATEAGTDCDELFPVRTVTLVVDLSNQKALIKGLGSDISWTQKDSCIKMSKDKSSTLGVTLENADGSLKVLCEAGACFQDGDEHADLQIKEIDRPPNPDAIIVSEQAGYNSSESCNWIE